MAPLRTAAIAAAQQSARAKDDYVLSHEFDTRLAEMRTLFHEQLHGLRTQILNEREIAGVRTAASDKALALQAREYERRLDDLNHAHQIAIDNWRTSLPRELFDTFAVDDQKWRDKASEQMVIFAQLPAHVEGLAHRLTLTENSLLQASGALTLIRFMGFAGVLALLVTFLRMAKLMP